jgi:hypothetical protein
MTPFELALMIVLGIIMGLTIVISKRLKLLTEIIAIQHSQTMTKLSESLVRTSLNTKMLEKLQDGF